MLSIRKSTANDLPAMLALYADARRFMAENGNPNQWVNGYPAREMLEADIASGNSYVCEEDGKVVGGSVPHHYFGDLEEEYIKRNGDYIADRAARYGDR